MSSPFKAICIFCGAKEGNLPQFKAGAEELVKLMNSKKINLVYGGGTVGLMGVLAKGIHAGNNIYYYPKECNEWYEWYLGGGEVIGIIPTALAPRELSSDMIG